MKTVFAFGFEINVEDWVKYIAIDMDGGIFGHELKPELNSDGNWYGDDDGRVFFVGVTYQQFPENELLIVGV